MINTVIWCNDLSENSGEGKLARKFISKYFSKKKKINFKANIKFFNFKIFKFYFGNYILMVLVL